MTLFALDGIHRSGDRRERTARRLGWAIAFELVNDLAFANVFPIGLALFSRAAPKKLSGMLIGVFYLHLFLANFAVGWLGGLLERMPAAAFWTTHAGLIGGAALVLLGARFAAGRSLAPAYHAPTSGPGEPSTSRADPGA